MGQSAVDMDTLPKGLAGKIHLSISSNPDRANKAVTGKARCPPDLGLHTA